MKKIFIFLALFIGVFCLTSNFAQAEIKVFEFHPNKITTGDLLGNIKKDIFGAFLGKDAIASIIERTQKNNYFVFDDRYGSGATDEYFGFYAPSEISYVSDAPFNQLKPIDCGKVLAKSDDSQLFGFLSDVFGEYLVKPAQAARASCYEPIGRATEYFPYYVYEAEVITDTIHATYPSSPYSKNDEQCKMDIMITGGGCYSGVNFYGAAGDYCWNDKGKSVSTFLDTSYLSEVDQIAAACAHVRLYDTSNLFTQIQWGGHIRMTGKKGSLKNFAVWGPSATTGILSVATVGKVLEICKDSSVTIKWSTEDGVGEVRLFGNKGTVWSPLNPNDSVSHTPTETTTYYLQYQGYTGSGPLWQLEGPITVNPVDCLPTPVDNSWVKISANPNTIDPGESSTLTWNSGNVDSCQAVGNSSDWKGSKPVKGSASVTPDSTRWYDIKCIKGTTTVTDDVRVKVNNANAPTGNLDVKIRLNGVEVTTPTSVSFDITGPETINVSEAPKTLSDITAGTYNLRYVDGGPANSTFLNFSPGYTILVSANQTATVYLDFSDGARRCNITVQALKSNCDGSDTVQWTGPLSYALLGPIILNGTAVNQTFESIPTGRYYLTSLIGGPGTYNGVEPGNPVACPSGGNVTLMMKFKDCGASSYKCNFSTGRCELCGAYSEECKYNNLSDCNMQCAGCATSHDPKANVFCWANFDSDNCIGINDNNANTPSVILYDKSTDSCGDIKNCSWEILNHPEIQIVNSCGPYPWYDETPGTYTAKLTVTDSQDSSSTDTQIFTIKNVDALTCNFAWDPDAPTVSGATSFFDQTLTPNGTTLKSWSWTFQSATPASSTAQTVQNVVFNSAGVKNVTLTVKNSANATCALTKQITVKTINPYWREVVPF